ncbi:hypothetical protein PPUN15366_05520 [Pseudomonas putida]|uniref:hypothetical protein n=1 Tax=Pseudomonas putida TaxID=303 RepID=UPI00235C05D4|nr:hypothetical protein [Pseudomonas putida]GLO38908.1 hypothetical protein PPUN15366_05520 [Pseudomonas putida]HDS0974471.1 hypothetical protein [Pseudomonas putida]
MTQYLVRIELFGASASSYEDLHESMEILGMKRSVRFSDGKDYAMPIGTYFGDSGLSLDALRDKVRATSKPLSPSKDAAVFVCAIQQNQWAAFLYTAD